MQNLHNNLGYHVKIKLLSMSHHIDLPVWMAHKGRIYLLIWIWSLFIYSFEPHWVLAWAMHSIRCFRGAVITVNWVPAT
jgi:hypothetical protein